VQLACPVRFWAVPGMHAVSFCAPVALTKYPVSELRQLVWPWSGMYVAGAHGEHEVERCELV
jgi:hypothetical protein